MSRSLPALALVVAVFAGGCFVLDRVAALLPGSVVGAATRPDVEGSPGAGFVRVSGVGSSLVRTGDAEGAFVVAGLNTGRLDLRLVDDVDGDGWADRGRDVSVLIADDFGAGSRGSVDVGVLPLLGTFGLRGVALPPAVLDDSQVIRVYALRGRCVGVGGDVSASNVGDGACDNVLDRLEHGVDGEAAVDDTGAWQLTRLVAGHVDIVAVLQQKNADGTLGAVIDVVGPLPFTGTATNENAEPVNANLSIVFDGVAPPIVPVQLSLSGAVKSDAFAVITPLGTAVPACASIDRDGVDVVEIAAGNNSVLISVPAGACSVVVCDGDARGSASSFVAVPGEQTARWPIVMLDDDSRCPLDPADLNDVTRDCDGDNVGGLPLSTIAALRERCALECFADETRPFDALGAAIGGRTCTVDDRVYDCDDDADGQPDVTEPAACIGANRGHDLDGDGLCSIVDSFPYCAANTAAACPAGDEEITPRVPSAGNGVVRGPVGAVVTITAGDNSVDVSIATASTDNGETLVYGEAAFALAGIDSETLTITPGTAVPGLVCGVVRSSPLVIGCEHGFDHLTGIGTFNDGAEVAVGGLDDDEGRYVAFASAAAIAGNTNDARQIFWRDRGTGVTLLISAVGGVASTASNVEPTISADGLSVAFTSSAVLVGDDTNGRDDIYLWRAAAPDVLERISIAADGTQGDGVAANASLNIDGSAVAFTSTSSTLSLGVRGTSTFNVFHKDLDDGIITLLSASSGTGVGGDVPAISHDGRRVAFWSFSSAIVANDQNGIWDIFVADLDDVTRRISVTSAGGEREQANDGISTIFAPAISGDGRFVGWSSTASNIVGDDDNGTVEDVFVTELASGKVIRASAGSIADSPRGQNERVSFSADGRFVVFTSGDTAFGPVVVRDLSSEAVTSILPRDVNGVGVPVISANGSCVVVGSATALDPRIASSGIFAVFTGLAPSWWSAR